MTRCPFEIDGRPIGPEHPPYVIAELSANHNGKLQRALDSIEAAKEAGADAVKIQSYSPDTITLDHDGPDFRISGGLWNGYRLYDLYAEAQTPFEWHPALFEKARNVGITLFSSPFDATAIDMLEGLGTPAYKIASFEAIDLPLITRAAQTGKPLIISTGMADDAEIAEALAAAKSAGASQVALLHCISGYPAPISQSNLKTIPAMAARFDATIGLSDHSLGTAVSVASVALGATIIEKHFQLDDTEDGPDSAFSLTPDALKTLCTDTRAAWEALGEASFARKPAEEGNVQFRRSLYFVRDVAAGQVITDADIRSIRPGYGLKPKYWQDVIGCTAVRSIQRGTPVSWELLKDKTRSPELDSRPLSKAS
ncbi:MAG: pseudaminic acid synthase [Pseudomonadota bacterium]